MWVVVMAEIFAIICNLCVMRITSRSVINFTGKLINDILSFLVFSVVDVLDILLCYVYKIVDFFVEDEWKAYNATENVLFIHGFISSSAFWTETLFPNFSRSTKSKYRLFAIDLLGFGKSPKPQESLYTMKDHLDMIERSVLEPNKVESFHIVAHSLGCILALALAVKHPKSVKSLTLLAPPYFPTPKGEEATQYMMRKVAPRQVWPLIVFGASMACWYEHVSRTICLLICKHHRTWEFLAKLITRNR
ncbi:hypothetical protein E3N88_27044 [Mikania micrantha]|uniref:AB hydrolase-1 domain-containing protein n=1 Tax=Mikania micrantha TaxID=192012 RepID=A0A5N6MVK2_9ASTR|nr:hypothetical protein E3N88_27044 [Mikania micrantha]